MMTHCPFPIKLTFATLCMVLGFTRPSVAEGVGALLLQIDNDKVVDTDRHYTNGMRIAYSANTPSGQWKTTGQTLADLTYFTDTSGLRTGWTLGQDMYTPEDVDTYTPDPLDRPYAGWAYVGLSAQNETGDNQDTLELDVGMIGPAAHAGQLQNAFHRLINVSVSRGWRSQIHNELGLLATRTHKRRMALKSPFATDWLNTDIIGHGTAQLGNVRTAAAAGATVRIGKNLQGDFGPAYGTFALPQRSPDAFSYALFLGAEARATAWDVFLDGNTFKDSPDVKKNPYTIEARAGVSTYLPLPDHWRGEGVRLSINMVQRTREFKTQDKADRYGSLQMTVNF